MEKSSVQLQRELARTEKNLEFIQNEHSKILAGLHNEIACLTQKCSGKFSPATFSSHLKNVNYRSSVFPSHADRSS